MERPRKHLICCLFLAIAVSFLAAPANSQMVEMSSSLNPVGSGARALGMGGAFISVADDATAASWNPAGLVQLEKPEVSAVYQYFHRSQSYDSQTHPEINGDNNMDSTGLNYASAAYPFVALNRNMILSINYQRLYEMDKMVEIDYTWAIGPDTLYDNIRFDQDGFLYTLSPALAVQITPSFYLGATLNFWDDFLGDNGWKTVYKSRAQGDLAGSPVELTLDLKERTAFDGINAHFGFLWAFHPSITLGGVVKTPFEADLRKETEFSQSQYWPEFDDFSASTESSEDDFTMEMPMSFGLGISYRHSDTLTVALDIYRTQWSDFLIRDPEGSEINPLTGSPVSEGSLKDTTQVRLGAEYLFIRNSSVIPVRCGLFYDPEPATESLDDYIGFSLGAGYVTQRVSLDVAYQYRTGSDVAGDLPAVSDNQVDLSQSTVMASAIIYF